jgi:hypothetical protein
LAGSGYRAALVSGMQTIVVLIRTMVELFFFPRITRIMRPATAGFLINNLWCPSLETWLPIYILAITNN